MNNQQKELNKCCEKCIETEETLCEFIRSKGTCPDWQICPCHKPLEEPVKCET
jgi:hypothetical protein